MEEDRRMAIKKGILDYVLLEQTEQERIRFYTNPRTLRNDSIVTICTIL